MLMAQPEELRRLAAELSNLAQRQRDLDSEVRHRLNEVIGMWRGSAPRAIEQIIGEIDATPGRRYELLSDVVGVLSQAAMAYEQVDADLQAKLGL